MRGTATPARHGPPHADRGPVIGFVLEWEHAGGALYLSGDTVWFDGVADVAARFPVRTAVLFLGAARVAAAGDWPLTFTAEDAVEAARAFGVPFRGGGGLRPGRADRSPAVARGRTGDPGLGGVAPSERSHAVWLSNRWGPAGSGARP